MEQTQSARDTNQQTGAEQPADQAGGARYARAGRGHRSRATGDDQELARFRALARRRPKPQEQEPGQAVPPHVSGPLAHQSSVVPVEPAAAVQGVGKVDLSALAHRLLTGVTVDGEPTARIELAAGAFAGARVELVAGVRGMEVTVAATTSAARRTIESQLAELHRALSDSGVRVRKIRVDRGDSSGKPRHHARR